MGVGVGVATGLGFSATLLDVVVESADETVTVAAISFYSTRMHVNMYLSINK